MPNYENQRKKADFLDFSKRLSRFFSLFINGNKEYGD